MCCRKTMYIVFVTIGTVLGLSSNALAADYRDWYDTDPADHLWSTPGNWNPVGLPTLIGDNNNRTRIREGSPGPGGEYPILDATIFTVDPGGAFADRVYVGHSGNNSGWPNETATLTVTGGAELTVGNDLKIAYGRYTLGTLYVSGSDTVINVGEDLMVGRRDKGILEMTGGTINVAVDLRIPEESDDENVDGTGLLKLHGGTIIVGEDLIMRPVKSGKVRKGDMDIAGDGKLVIAGDVTETVNDYIGKGWITGNGESDPRLIKV